MTHARVITFPAEFWPDKIICVCVSLAGLVYTKTIIHLSVDIWISTAIHLHLRE